MNARTSASNSDTAARRVVWALRGKLRPPLRYQSVIRRVELIRLLDEVLNHTASVLIAPAGFGKTTILTQWRERMVSKGVRLAWLTVDSQDDDAHRLVCYCIFALSEAGVDLGQLEGFAQQGLHDIPLESVLVRMLDAIEETNQKVALVLDDYHRIESPSINDLFDTLIDNAPDNFHLIISSRQRPAFDLEQHFVTGKGIQLDSETLRFSDAEMNEALHDIGDSALVDTIKRTTEGWPVAVQLARLAYADGASFQQAAGTGREGHIANYFSEQVVRGLGDELQAFLTRTAILDQFNIQLAGEVYGGKDAAKVLGQLGDLGALIVRLDEAGEWYRYHHLFADFLLSRLKEREPEAIASLHLRASKWFESDGDTQQAVRHAVDGDDLERAAGLIESAGGWELILFGGIGYLRNLLNLMPAMSLDDFPRLQVAQAYLLLKTGKVFEARAWLDRALQNPILSAYDGERSAWFERDVLNVGCLLHSYEDDERALCRADLPEKMVVPGSHASDVVTHAVLACYQVVGELAEGKFEASKNTIRKAMRFMRQSNSILGLNYCYLHSAVAHFHQCQVNKALADAQESSAMAADNFGSDSGLKSLSDVILGVLLFWRNQINEEGWHRFEMAFEHIAKYDGWFDIYSLALEASVERALLQGRPEEANRAIERGRKLAQEKSMDRFDAHIDSLALTIAVECEDYEVHRQLAHEVSARHAIGAWQDRPFVWRNHVYRALALASNFASQEPSRSLLLLRDAIECCRRIGARFWLIRLRAAQATLLDQNGERQRSIDALSKALELARPEELLTAVARPRAILGTLRHAQRHWRREPGNTATRRFAGEAINLLQHYANIESAHLDDQVSLSPREMEVLWELSLGRSNKQIARALYMTEHTVKYHLKNVFRKLSVNRRTEALKVAHEAGLI
ncbi:MAG: LuxR C-terminal-related transcriptional regulator [Gammaproteobacteria bacterium]|nr:LuxR C-terminal-related transcriptional regulator [Gammaproteobacteria bacterium]